MNLETIISEISSKRREIENGNLPPGVKTDILHLYDTILAQTSALLPIQQNLSAIQNQIIEPTIGNVNAHFERLNQSGAALDRKNTVLSLIGIGSGVIGILLTIYPFIFSGALDTQRNSVINYYLGIDRPELAGLKDITYDYADEIVFPKATEVTIEPESINSLIKVSAREADLTPNNIQEKLTQLDTLMQEICLASNPLTDCKLTRLNHDNVNLGANLYDRFSVSYSHPPGTEFPEIMLVRDQMGVVLRSDSITFEEMTNRVKRHTGPTLDPRLVALYSRTLFRLTGSKFKLNLDANVFDRVFQFHDYPNLRFQRSLIFN